MNEELLSAELPGKVLRGVVDEVGVSMTELSEHLGVAIGTISDLIQGKRKQVTRRVHDAILAIDVDEVYSIYRAPDFAIIDSLMHGGHPAIPHGRKADYIRYLACEGLNKREIAEAVRASGGDVRRALDG